MCFGLAALCRILILGQSLHKKFSLYFSNCKMLQFHSLALSNVLKHSILPGAGHPSWFISYPALCLVVVSQPNLCIQSRGSRCPRRPSVLYIFSFLLSGWSGPQTNGTSQYRILNNLKQNLIKQISSMKYYFQHITEGEEN